MNEQDLHTFGWYAARVTPHLPKEAFKPVPARLWGGLFFLIVSILGIMAISLYELPFYLNLLVAGILGSSFASMGFLGHEILHGTVVRKAWLRDLLGAIAMWPLCTGPRLWRKWHNMQHHLHTQDPHHDPDAWPNMEQLEKMPFFVRWAYKLPQWVRAIFDVLLLAVTFSLHSISQFVNYLRDPKAHKWPKVVIQFILPWASWIALLFYIGPVKWCFAFLLPLLLANFIVMSYISTNHRLNPLVPVNDPLANSLTVTVPKWVDLIHFNFSYHTEHHLFPGMSPKYYPLVKAEVKRMWPERYHEMPMHKALKALWITPRVYFEERELVDPKKGDVYGSLGHGLDPDNISVNKNIKQEEVGKMEESPTT